MGAKCQQLINVDIWEFLYYSYIFTASLKNYQNQKFLR